MPQILRVGGLDTVQLLKARRHLLDASQVHPLQIYILVLLTCARTALTGLRQQPTATVEQLRWTAQHGPLTRCVAGAMSKQVCGRRERGLRIDCGWRGGGRMRTLVRL